MGKGSQIVPIRIGYDTLAEIDRLIEELNQRTAGQPYDRSSFIRCAIGDKIKHIWRSRKKAKPAPFPQSEEGDF